VHIEFRRPILRRAAAHMDRLHNARVPDGREPGFGQRGPVLLRHGVQHVSHGVARVVLGGPEKRRKWSRRAVEGASGDRTIVGERLHLVDRPVIEGSRHGLIHRVLTTTALRSKGHCDQRRSIFGSFDLHEEAKHHRERFRRRNGLASGATRRGSTVPVRSRSRRRAGESSLARRTK
jgi:hypothetical protein